MLLAAADEGCVNEVHDRSSVPSPSKIPAIAPFEKREAADQLHAEFNDESSDFLSWLNLWSFVTVQKENLSNSQFRKMCRQRFLSALRVLEWMDVRRQLERLAKELKLPISTGEAAADNVHRAPPERPARPTWRDQDRQAGLPRHPQPPPLDLSRAPRCSERGRSGSWPARSPETSRLWARSVGTISPEWIEREAGHLLSWSYRDAPLAAKAGHRRCLGTGDAVRADRQPEEARQLRADQSRRIPSDLHSATLSSAASSARRATSTATNQTLLEEVATLEDKSRRRDIVVDPEELVRSLRHHHPRGGSAPRRASRLGARTTRRTTRARSTSSASSSSPTGRTRSAIADYPNQIEMSGVVLPLTYHFAPGEEDDGVTIVCPVELLNRGCRRTVASGSCPACSRRSSR